MSKRNRFVLTATVVIIAVLSCVFVWNKWFAPTRIAFVNYRPMFLGNVAKANDNKFIKLSEVSLEELEKLSRYDMVIVNGMGLKTDETGRNLILRAAEKGAGVYTSLATNPANDICSLSKEEAELLAAYIVNGGRANYRNLLNYIRASIDKKKISLHEVEPPVEEPSDILYHRPQRARKRTHFHFPFGVRGV